MTPDLGPKGRELVASLTAALPPELQWDERDEALLERAGKLRDRMESIEATLAGLDREVKTSLHIRLLAELRQSESVLARLLGQLDLRGDAKPQTATSVSQRRRAERRWAEAPPSRRAAKRAS